VGLAAIQIALNAGAEIYATAGRLGKREYLKTIGVRHVFDSRSVRFAEEVRDVTGGEGVDVVLNSLGAEFIPASLEVLRAEGRFLEIGKRDIHENYKLGLKPFGNNLSYSAIDIDKLLLRNPDLCARLFAEIMDRVVRGEYRPLPFTTFPADEVEAAFRHMTGAKHVGKVVVTYDRDQTVVVAPHLSRQTLFHEDGTYLVTGGVSGFGLRTAQWMVERGARPVVLASRRGKVAPEEQPAVEAMRARGATIILEKADVSVEEEVKALRARLRHLPPLRGNTTRPWFWTTSYSPR
jgi:NADPH:quinone reductase-like Zn-dependent oxidoreductase